MSQPRLAIIGEYYEEEDARQGKAFVDSPGRILNFFLRNAGLRRSEALVTNVFNLRSSSNNVDSFCGPKAEALEGYDKVRQGKYIRAEFAGELDRLNREIMEFKPQLVLALGNSALLAATNNSGIRKMRGYPMWSDRWNCKVIGTYHPLSVRKQWNLNPVVLADMEKVVAELEFPEIRRPNRELWIEPTLEDLPVFYQDHILPYQHECLSVDIETHADQITCIGFAPTSTVALVVPFLDWSKPGNNYWSTLAEECEVYKWIKYVLENAPRVLGQNFTYDIKYLYRYGIAVPGYCHDTMLHSHAQQPELEKGLNFLASIHTSEASWKFMRNDIKTIKTED